MAALLAGAHPASPASLDSPAPPPWRWPRLWSEREPLLERQHDRLDARLIELIELIQLIDDDRSHRPALTAVTSLAADLACRRLLWQLRLHLRLEERWLAAQGCLCPGHRAAHADAAHAALSGFIASQANPRARLAWLQDLRTWFVAHRTGPDARLYATARAAAVSARCPLP